MRRRDREELGDQARLRRYASSSLLAPLLALALVCVGCTNSRAGIEAERAATTTERVLATGDLILALRQEQGATVVQVLDTAELLEGDTLELGTTREATDSAVEELDGLSAWKPEEDASAAGSATPSFRWKDQLSQLRRDVNAQAPSLTQLGSADELFDRYATIIGGLVEEAHLVALSIDNPEVRRGAELYSLGLSQAYTTDLLAHALIFESAEPALERDEWIAEVAGNHGALTATDSDLRSLAQGTVYEAAVSQLFDELDDAGFRELVVFELERGTVDVLEIGQLLDSLTMVGVQTREFLDRVEMIMREPDRT